MDAWLRYLQHLLYTSILNCAPSNGVQKCVAHPVRWPHREDIRVCILSSAPTVRRAAHRQLGARLRASLVQLPFTAPALRENINPCPRLSLQWEESTVVPSASFSSRRWLASHGRTISINLAAPPLRATAWPACIDELRCRVMCKLGSTKAAMSARRP